MTVSVLGNLPADKWERAVLRELESQCPQGWLVLCGVDWNTRRPGGYVRSGEADFVVLIPCRGMIVVEVKGSRRFWVDDAGAWFREEQGRPERLKRTPHKQASDNMHELVAIILRALDRPRFPGSYAHVVVYPNGELVSAPTTYDRSTLVTRSGLHELADRLNRALNAAGPSRKVEEFDESLTRRFARILLGGDFQIVPAAGTDDRDGADLSPIEQLTRQQAAALKGIYMFPSVAVSGPAGSGKTILATWRLRDLTEEGRHALYVCYNRKLADRLRQQMPDLAEHIWNVDRLFTRIIGKPLNVIGDPTQYFRESLPLEAMTTIEDGGADRYDSIIVDEGQDFSELQICVLQELLIDANDTSWWLFCDWAQDLYDVRQRKSTGADLEFRLFHNCRNTRLVNDSTNRLVEARVDSVPGAPDGIAPEVFLVKSGAGIVNKIWELANRWKARGTVAVLSPVKLESTSLSAHQKAHGLVLSEAIEDLDDAGCVGFSTVKGFKGIEADSVILIEPPIPAEDTFFTRADLYVACTRPTSNLAIVTTSPSVESWFSRQLSEK